MDVRPGDFSAFERTVEGNGVSARDETEFAVNAAGGFHERRPDSFPTHRFVHYDGVDVGDAVDRADAAKPRDRPVVESCDKRFVESVERSHPRLASQGDDLRLIAFAGGADDDRAMLSHDPSPFLCLVSPRRMCGIVRSRRASCAAYVPCMPCHALPCTVWARARRAR